jgi:hypothetical protein
MKHLIERAARRFFFVTLLVFGLYLAEGTPAPDVPGQPVPFNYAQTAH